jgi:hypothetical protein
VRLAIVGVPKAERVEFVYPENEMILCDRPKCEAIADYLEVEADGTEHFHCRFHTTSDTYACRLLARAPDRNRRYRSIQLV